MLFFLKKFIAQFLMPMPLVCEAFILGWILQRFTKYKKTGRFFTLFAFLLFILFGYGFGRSYLYNLERRYPPFDPTPAQGEALRGAFVVVLGQGMPEKSDLPIRYQNNPVFERRLFEGIRVATLIPDSQLIVSMAGEAPICIKQTFLNEYMARVNFPTNRVTMFITARDTAEEARLAKQVIINQRSNGRTAELTNFRTNSLILATSASHMHRAMKIFQKQGLAPIPSPCDYGAREYPMFKMIFPYLPFPSGSGFDTSQSAMYEWLGSIYEQWIKR